MYLVNSRAYREKLKSDPATCENFKQNQKERQKKLYQSRKNDPQFMNLHRKKNRDNYRNKRDRNLHDSSNSSTTDDSNIGKYKSAATFSKAIKKLESNLPRNKENQVAVVDKPFYTFHPDRKPNRKTKRVRKPCKQLREIEEFYNRDDVSQMLPGKNDVKRVTDSDGNVKMLQKRVMLLTVGGAYQEFKKLHQKASDVSMTTFFRLKPKQIMVNSKMPYIGCLCKTHVNIEYLFNSIKNKSEPKFENAEAIVNFYSCGNELCDGISCDACKSNFENIQTLFSVNDKNELITVKEWKTDRFNKVNLSVEKRPLEDIVKILPKELLKFKRHLHIQKTQYKYFRECIDGSDEENVVIQVDFSENYKCIRQNEIQSAYFEHSMVSLFTIAIWSGNKNISRVFSTDDHSHSKFSVAYMMKKLVSQTLNDCPNMKNLKVFSDGCAGQFKNRWIMSSIVNTNIFPINTEWNFFAPGHGKGKVDGIGGCAKRSAYFRVLSGTCEVQNAQ